MSAILAIVLALICLAGGGLIGFFVARGSGSDAKRAEAVREEFDTYRRDVTAHFGETAEHFRTLGRQYRELYEHMASGADALCDTDTRARLDFPSLRAIEAVAEAADDADTAAAAEREGAPEDDNNDPGAADEAKPTNETAPDDRGESTAGHDAVEPDVDAANDDDVTDDDAPRNEDTTEHDVKSADEEPEGDRSEASESDQHDEASSDPDRLRRAGAT